MNRQQHRQAERAARRGDKVVLVNGGRPQSVDPMEHVQTLPDYQRAGQFVAMMRDGMPTNITVLIDGMARVMGWSRKRAAGALEMAANMAQAMQQAEAVQAQEASRD